MKIIIHWQGTDALCLKTTPPGNKLWQLKLILYRWKWKLLKRFIHEHWVVHIRLKKYLIDFGIDKRKIKKRIMPGKYMDFERKPHEGFNVLYYCPSKAPGIMGMKYVEWVYGWDVYLKVKEYLKGGAIIRFIHIDGSASKEDMDDIWSITDFLLRPNRHDGMPRMILEAQRAGIPYYWDQGFRPLKVEVIGVILKEFSKHNDEQRRNDQPGQPPGEEEKGDRHSNSDNPESVLESPSKI